MNQVKMALAKATITIHSSAEITSLIYQKRHSAFLQETAELSLQELLLTCFMVEALIDAPSFNSLNFLVQKEYG